MNVRKIERGIIWIVELTKTPSDIVEHEQGYTRPCLIIVNNPKIKMTTIIPLTRNLNALKYPHTYLINRSSKNGLDSDSMALIFQIRSLSYERFITYKGELDSVDLKNIIDLIKNYFKISKITN